MKTLITGAEGQVGWELQETKPHDLEIIALDHAQLDITATSSVGSTLRKYKPDLIINTAAYTAVDRAESEKDKAFSVNAFGAANIARTAEKLDIRVIHLSTDFVFDGCSCRPYRPDDKPNPVGVYGDSKLQGEQHVMAETCNKALIIRTSWVYSSHGSNFVKTILRLMAEKNAVNIVSDQIGTPTWARDLAKAIWHFVRKPELRGIFHWSDAGVASWYDFGVAVQEEAHELGILQGVIPVLPIRSADYPTPAKRPSYSVLDKTETWAVLEYQALHWRKALRLMLKQLREE